MSDDRYIKVSREQRDALARRNVLAGPFTPSELEAIVAAYDAAEDYENPNLKPT